MVICSDEFGPLARAESEVLGVNDLPLIAIPHPLAGNDEQLVCAKGAALASEVRAALTGNVENVSRQYVGRFSQLTQRRLAQGAVCLDEACSYDPTLSDNINVA